MVTSWQVPVTSLTWFHCTPPSWVGAWIRGTLTFTEKPEKNTQPAVAFFETRTGCCSAEIHTWRMTNINVCFCFSHAMQVRLGSSRFVWSKMKPRLLLPILAWISQIPVPHVEDSLDVVICLKFILKTDGDIILGHLCPSLIDFTVARVLYAVGFVLKATTTWPKVEIRAGEGQLSRALNDCGYRIKPFDVSWHQTWKHSICETWDVATCCHATAQTNHLIGKCLGFDFYKSKVRYSANHNLMRTTGFIAALCAVECSGSIPIHIIPQKQCIKCSFTVGRSETSDRGGYSL